MQLVRCETADGHKHSDVLLHAAGALANLTLFEGAQKLLVEAGAVDLLLKLCRPSTGQQSEIESTVESAQQKDWNATVCRFCAGTLANLALKLDFLPVLLDTDCIDVMVQLTKTAKDHRVLRKSC